MPRKIYKEIGPDIISFVKKVGNYYKVQSREIRVLYRDEKGDLYIRTYKSGKQFVRVKHSKNKKVGLYVVR